MKYITASFTLVLTVSMYLQISLQAQLDQIEASIDRMATSYKNSRANDELTIADLHSVLIENSIVVNELSRQLDQMPSPDVLIASTSTNEENLSASTNIATTSGATRETNKELNANDKNGLSSDVEDVLAIGLLDDTAWKSLHSNVTAMSKEENKRFWTEVFSRVDKGELIIPEV